MNPWIPHLLRAGGGGGAVLPPAGRTMLANLTSSLILDEGTGGPTWSRATKAWGFNELGYLEELASGCAFFGGARLVRNRLGGNSDNYSSGVPNSVTIVNASEPNHRGTNTAVRYAVTPGLDFHFVRSTILAADYPGGATLRATVVVSRNLYRYIGIRAGQTSGSEVIDLQTNTWVTNRVETLHRSFEIIDANWIRLTTSAYFAATTTKVFDITPASPTGLEYWTAPAGLEFVIADAQLNNISNYDASYVPEYVSVGVEASPYFGAGIDGAKYFETDWQGAPIAAANLLRVRRESSAINNLLWSRDLTVQTINAVTKRWDITGTSGPELVTNGTFAADLADWTATVGSGGTISAAGGVCTFVSDGGTYTGITNSASLTVGTTYVLTIVASGTGTLKFSSTLEISQIGNGTTVCSFVATGTTISLARAASVACNLAIDSISIKAAAVQCARATGLDGLANTATTLTATAADAIILQPISLASAARCASAYVKRRTGTGTISFTQDGGSTWTDITSLINSSTWSRVEITATLANPSVGFKISTSGDAIDVDCVQNEAGAVATSPIVTTTAAITRNADSDTYQTASNWSDTAGTAYIEAQPWQWSSGGLLGSATNGLLGSASNSGATAYDGTNTANGPTGTPSGRKKLALRWTGATMDVSVGGVIGTAGTYDGAMGLASLGIAVNSSGYFGPVAVWNYAMTDDEFKALTT